MKKLGVAWIISVSAVGSLQAKYKPCDIVCRINSSDRTKQSSAHSYFGRGIVRPYRVCDRFAWNSSNCLESARALKSRFTMAALRQHGRAGFQHPG